MNAHTQTLRLLAASALLGVTALAGTTETFPIHIGSTISPGFIDDVATAGPGSIENPGDQDHYTFQGTVGQTIYLDNLAFSNNSLRWVLRDPGGDVVAQNWISVDLGRHTLQETGPYEIQVYGYDGDDTGTYSFKLWGVSDDVFPLEPEDVVTDGAINGIPAEGAGNLEQPGTYDIYTFQGAVGQTIYLDNLAFSNNSLRWVLRDPGGDVVAQNWISVDLGRHTLQETGPYEIQVYGYDGDDTGTYSFQLNGLRSPVAGDDVAGTTVNRAVGLPIARLLANDTDPDHDTLTLALPAGTTTEGGTVAISGSNVRYTPPTDFDGTDTFTYEVDDGWEHSDTATVTVRVRRPETLGLNTITALRNPDGSIALEMAGIPGQTYQLWYAPGVVAGPWAVLAAVVADANGVVRYTDTSAIGVPSRFYRLAEAP